MWDKMTAEAVANGIVERERSDAALRYGVLDPACFKEDGGPSIAERINKVLIQARLRPFHAADNSRVPQRGSMGGWDQVRSRLVGQDGRPMIYCFSNHADSVEQSRPSSTIQHGLRTSTPIPRTMQGTNGATLAYLGRSCGYRWHARGACQTWDTLHSALPRRMIGNSTDGPGRQTPSARRAASANFAADCMRCVGNVCRGSATTTQQSASLSRDHPPGRDRRATQVLPQPNH